MDGDTHYIEATLLVVFCSLLLLPLKTKVYIRVQYKLLFLNNIFHFGKEVRE